MNQEEKDKSQLTDPYRILVIPNINIAMTNLYLPTATLKNSGGYRIKTNYGDVLSLYSPIDLAVAGLTALFHGEQSITDLNKWFISNPERIAELWVTCTTLRYLNETPIIETHTIMEYKFMCKEDTKFLSLLKRNAPFTFRNL